MNDETQSGGAGGAANEIGGEFRARVAAWLISHALVGRRITALDLPAGLDVPNGVVCYRSISLMGFRSRLLMAIAPMRGPRRVRDGHRIR